MCELESQGKRRREEERVEKEAKKRRRRHHRRLSPLPSNSFSQCQGGDRTTIQDWCSIGNTSLSPIFNHTGEKVGYFKKRGEVLLPSPFLTLLPWEYASRSSDRIRPVQGFSARFFAGNLF